MLFQPRPFDGLLVPSATGRFADPFGTTVTPASGSKGSWAEVFSSAPREVVGLEIQINGNRTLNASRDTLLDVGIGAAGSEVVIIPDLICGDAGPFTNGTMAYLFPFRIPEGTRIAVRAASTVTTAFSVLINLMTRQPFAPMIEKVSAVGVSTATAGTGLTPGTASFSAWVSLGTLPHDAFWWQIGGQVNAADTSHNAAGIDLQLAYGDASTKVPLTQLALSISGNEQTCQYQNRIARWKFAPSGTTLYVRGQSSAATVDPLNIVAYAGV